MKKAILVLILALALVLAGCAGGGERKEEKVPTSTPAQTPSETKQTPSPSRTEEKPSSATGGISTLYDLYLNRKVLHGTAKITMEGKTQTYEFWYYFDADSREVMMRMEAQTQDGTGVTIMKQKYEGNTLTMTIYSRGGQMMPGMGDCDWVGFRQTITVSPSEYEDVKDEPVTESFEATMMRQGNMVENYRVEYVDYNPSLFQPDGKVCEVGSFNQG